MAVVDAGEMGERERRFWRSRLAAAHRHRDQALDDGVDAGVAGVQAAPIPKPSAALGRTGIPRGKEGLPITEADPEMRPYRARGFGVWPGLFDVMLNTSGTLGGAMALIIREISSAPVGIRIPPNPTQKEGLAAELVARYTGIDGRGGWIRGGLARHFRQAGRAIPYGFQGFERLWEAWSYPGLPGGVAVAPSNLQMRASRAVKGWAWEGDRLAGMIQAYAEAEIDLRLAYKMGLTADQMGFGGWSYWGKTVTIPASQLLLYTYDPCGEQEGAPEGRSALRPARRWYELQRQLLADYNSVAQRMAYGVTRLKRRYDDEGYPVGDASKQAEDDFDDEFAAWVDDDLDVIHEPPGYEVVQEFPLSKVSTPEGAMRYCDEQMRLASLASFMGGNTGTATEITAQMLYNAVNDTGKWLCEVFNGQARIETTGVIRQFIDANIDHSGESFRYPEIYLKGVEHKNLKAYFDSITKLYQYRGVLYSWKDEIWLRDQGDLPPLDAEQITMRQEYEKVFIQSLAKDPNKEISQKDTQSPAKAAPEEMPVDDPDGEDDAE